MEIRLAVIDDIKELCVHDKHISKDELVNIILGLKVEDLYSKNYHYDN